MAGNGKVTRLAPRRYTATQIWMWWENMDKTTIKLGLVLGIVITVGILISHFLFHLTATACTDDQYCNWGWVALTVTLLLSMIITLFGVLALPGGHDGEGIFREERVRLAIASTLLVVYFVLFSNAVLFGKGDTNINEEMMKTLTQLMTIVLPFYFGTSGLVEWAKRRKEKQ